jgi:hypothetical protein
VGRSGRRVRLAIVVVAILGLGGVVSIAVASRSDTAARIDVGAPAPGDQTSTNADATNETASSANPTRTSETTSSLAPIETTPSTVVTSLPAVSTPARTTGGPLSDGSYVGVEHFALFTGRCSFLDHHIVGTFSSSDGTTWTFHQDYCGTLNGDLWSGVGTFALTASDGATISGTVNESNIKVPSPGVPYTIDVTAGTQRFAGAAGTCRLDNHLRVIQFGLQDDFGTFTCDIRV